MQVGGLQVWFVGLVCWVWCWCFGGGVVGVVLGLMDVYWLLGVLVGSYCLWLVIGCQIGCFCCGGSGGGWWCGLNNGLGCGGGGVL